MIIETEVHSPGTEKWNEVSLRNEIMWFKFVMDWKLFFKKHKKEKNKKNFIRKSEEFTFSRTNSLKKLLFFEQVVVRKFNPRMCL